MILQENNQENRGLPVQPSVPVSTDFSQQGILIANKQILFLLPLFLEG